jgi:hypothetical protein
MATAERELRAAQNQMLFRSVNERMLEVGEAAGDGAAPELDFACECADDTCVDKIRLSVLQFLAIESDENQFVVLRGHEDADFEDVIAERDAFLIVATRGAGAEFVRERSNPRARV